MFVYLGDQMRLIAAGQVPTATADRELFFQDVSLLLQALLGLSVGEEQVRRKRCSVGKAYIHRTALPLCVANRSSSKHLLV